MTEMIGVFNELNEISSLVLRGSMKADENGQEKLCATFLRIGYNLNKALEEAEKYMQDDKDNNAD